MKQKLIMRFHLMWRVAILLALMACTNENLNVESNNGTSGTLSYEWSSGQDGDTVYLYCNQILNYTMQKKQNTVMPKATVKLWAEQPIIEYVAGMDPMPRYKDTTYDRTYRGTSPRQRIIHQQIKFYDEEILHVEISYDLYSYMGSTRELFFPHIEIKELVFEKAVIESITGYQRAIVTLNVPWLATDNSGRGEKVMTISYLKQRVQEKDVVLSTQYNTGVQWVGANTFQLYIDKAETWQIAGDKVTRQVSPEMTFNLTSGNAKTIEADNFDFNFTKRFSQTTKQNICNTAWQIKRSYATQTLMFSNGTNYFEDAFTYPLYDASVILDGQQFGIDLEVEFRAFNTISTTTTDGQNVSNAVLTFAGRTFSAQVTTKINKIEPTPPPSTGKGKIVYYSITAVFDQTALDEGGSITKKCVLVKYENGYDWGICEYEDDFPSSFTYTETYYGAFNSAAKRTKNDAFELARATETTSAILWYDENNAEISGIDGLTCRFYGWKNKYNDKFSYIIDGYAASLSSDSYTLRLTAPSGIVHVFSSIN